jgi:molybdopterin/thiamine biosynthesis adenylyltransferase
MEPWRGKFSFASFASDDASPSFGEVILDTTLVGVGGVGAGFIRTIAGLGDRVSGVLRLVDADILTTDNLNRVSFASLAGALAGTSKVVEAEALLARCCPHLRVFGHEMQFDEYKRRLGSREERRYDVVVTGLDDDEARREVQRDLPRILIDGATGRDMVARVERVEFGKYGCLGCSRPNAPIRDDQADCDAPPDPHAPSLSFLSAFPGVLAAGETIKEATGIQRLRGRFDHVFRYGPNPDMRSTPGIRTDCAVQCGTPSKLAQYERKYAS